MSKSVIYLSSILITLILLLLNINLDGLWLDEFHTIAVINGVNIYDSICNYDFGRLYLSSLEIQKFFFTDNFWINLKDCIEHEGHPPFYYISLKFWTYIFSDYYLSLKAFSFITYIGVMIVSIKILNFLKIDYKLFIVVFVSIPIFQIYSLEVRSYSLYLLLSVLSFYYFLKIYLKEYNFLYLLKFSVFSILMIFTHYYGVFIYSILSLVLLSKFINKGHYQPILIIISPILLLLIFSSIIINQLQVHSSHWTDGFYGLGSSILSFFRNFKVVSYSSWINHNMIGWLILIIFVFMYKRRNMIILLLLLLLPLQIIIFDFVLDHHTIEIPRYYMPIYFFLFLFLYILIFKSNLKFLKLCFILLVTSNLILSFSNLTNPLPKKQMVREVAHYIDNNTHKIKGVVVTSPDPIIYAISAYLEKDVLIKNIPIDSICSYMGKDSIMIIHQQLLYTDPKCVDYTNKNLTRFIAFDVYD